MPIDFILEGYDWKSPVRRLRSFFAAGWEMLHTYQLQAWNARAQLRSRMLYRCSLSTSSVYSTFTQCNRLIIFNSHAQNFKYQHPPLLFSAKRSTPKYTGFNTAQVRRSGRGQGNTEQHTVAVSKNQCQDLCENTVSLPAHC